MSNRAQASRPPAPSPPAESSPAEEAKEATEAGKTSKTSKASKQQVIDYLRQHPQFFMDEDELLAGLSLPHPSGKAVSLLERQVAVLRQGRQDARHKLHSLLTNARNNDQLFDTIGKLVLALLQADGVAAVVSTARAQLLAQPNIDACEIILCEGLGGRDAAGDAAADEAGAGDAAAASADEACSALRYLSARRLKTDYAEVFRLNRTHCGPLDEKRLNFLFPAGFSLAAEGSVTPIRSTALCPLHVAGSPALIALGNTRPDYFNIHLDTLFIDFIGTLLATLLERAQRSG